jgi:hypothetical protein
MPARTTDYTNHPKYMALTPAQRTVCDEFISQWPTDGIDVETAKERFGLQKVMFLGDIGAIKRTGDKLTRKRRPGRNGPSTVPRTGLETRPADDQNEHLWAIINKVKGTTQHVGLVANSLIGAESKSAGGFDKVSKELAPEYLAARTGLSPNTCRTHMGHLVKAGFFVRVDWARGGRANQNRAEYRATMPVYELRQAG